MQTEKTGTIEYMDLITTVSDTTETHLSQLPDYVAPTKYTLQPMERETKSEVTPSTIYTSIPFEPNRITPARTTVEPGHVFTSKLLTTPTISEAHTSVFQQKSTFNVPSTMQKQITEKEKATEGTTSKYSETDTSAKTTESMTVGSTGRIRFEDTDSTSSRIPVTSKTMSSFVTIAPTELTSAETRTTNRETTKFAVSVEITNQPDEYTPKETTPYEERGTSLFVEGRETPLVTEIPAVPFESEGTTSVKTQFESSQETSSIFTTGENSTENRFTPQPMVTTQAHTITSMESITIPYQTTTETGIISTDRQIKTTIGARTPTTEYMPTEKEALESFPVTKPKSTKPGTEGPGGEVTTQSIYVVTPQTGKEDKTSTVAGKTNTTIKLHSEITTTEKETYPIEVPGDITPIQTTHRATTIPVTEKVNVESTTDLLQLTSQIGYSQETTIQNEEIEISTPISGSTITEKPTIETTTLVSNSTAKEMPSKTIIPAITETSTYKNSTIAPFITELPEIQIATLTNPQTIASKTTMAVHTEFINESTTSTEFVTSEYRTSKEFLKNESTTAKVDVTNVDITSETSINTGSTSKEFVSSESTETEKLSSGKDSTTIASAYTTSEKFVSTEAFTTTRLATTTSTPVVTNGVALTTQFIINEGFTNKQSSEDTTTKGFETLGTTNKNFLVTDSTTNIEKLSTIANHGQTFGHTESSTEPTSTLGIKINSPGSLQTEKSISTESPASKPFSTIETTPTDEINFSTKTLQSSSGESFMKTKMIESETEAGLSKASTTTVITEPETITTEEMPTLTSTTTPNATGEQTTVEPKTETVIPQAPTNTAITASTDTTPEITATTTYVMTSKRNNTIIQTNINPVTIPEATGTYTELSVTTTEKIPYTSARIATVQTDSTTQTWFTTVLTRKNTTELTVNVTTKNCSANNDCIPSEYCTNNICINPCTVRGNCGINAICIVYNHAATCKCPNGLRGDPNHFCRQGTNNILIYNLTFSFST